MMDEDGYRIVDEAARDKSWIERINRESSSSRYNVAEFRLSLARVKKNIICPKPTARGNLQEVEDKEELQSVVDEFEKRSDDATESGFPAKETANADIGWLLSRQRPQNTAQQWNREHSDVTKYADDSWRLGRHPFAAHH